MNRQKISKLVASVMEEIVVMRRHLHQHPELSFQEHETANFVENTLNSYGIKTNRCAKTGVVALITPDGMDKNTPCIAFRADLDALPIQEETDLSYASKRAGIMHACGHDVHTAILLGLSIVLHQNRQLLQQPVKCIFQPGEEKLPGGASLMIQEGVLENPKVEQIFALHVFPELEAGKVGFKTGMYMASTDEIYITVEGKGGHAAMPHQVVDPIVIASSIVLQLQQVVSRKCDPKIPSVLSFGRFEANGATNVIPEKAFLEGTFRTMNETWRSEAHDWIKSQAEQIAASMGGNAIVRIEKGYPFLVNDEHATHQLRKAAEQQLGNERVVDLPIRMTGEDFSFYSQQVPSCFFRLGVRNEELKASYGVHNSKFAVDEAAMQVALEVYLSMLFSC